MSQREWSKIWHDEQLGVDLFHAFHINHAYPRHSHDYYVIGLINRGVQSFTYRGAKYITPAGGLILLNPGDVHTGEAVDKHGFEYCAIYLTVPFVLATVSEFTGSNQQIPYFSNVRVDHSGLANSVRTLHCTLECDASPLERETRFLWTLTELLEQFANRRPVQQSIGRERRSVQRACEYIEAHFAQGATLAELAEHVRLSPYHLLRVFHSEVGMPPHAYLESVRIREAQRLLAVGAPIVEVSFETGFSSQSHFTNRFKRFIGITPGQYVQQLKSNNATP